MSGRSSRRATPIEAVTPPAGPLSIELTGSAAIAAARQVPPLDPMMRSGASMPLSVRSLDSLFR